jgi:hypothetical protein
MHFSEEWIIAIIVLLIFAGIEWFVTREQKAGIIVALEQTGARHIHIRRIWGRFTNRRNTRTYHVRFQDRRGRVYSRTCHIQGWDLWVDHIEWDE